MRRRFFLAAPSLVLRGQPPADGKVTFPPRWSSAYTVDTDHPHHLVNREGRHLFVLNKTAWAYFACKHPEAFLERSRQQGITVIRVALEGRIYFSALGMDMWPWGGTRERPEWNRFNEPYWKEVERRIRLAGEAGIGLDVVLYANLHPGGDAIETHRPYLQRTIQQLGQYANILTWEVANEYLENETFQDAAGKFLAASDPLRRPVCTSDGTTDDAAWPQKSWVGLAVVHTCTGSTRDWPLGAWYQSVARNVRAHDKPAFNNESGREKRHRNDDPVHRRKQSWTWCCCGAYWTYHSWEGCEGIDDASYRGPGSEYLKPLSDFFQSVPFWRLDPNHTAVRVAGPGLVVSVRATPERDEVLAYLCTEQTGAAVEGQAAQIRLPAGEYQISFLRPVDTIVTGGSPCSSEGVGRTQTVSLPAFTDDLLIRIQQTRRGKQRVVKGTG